MRGLVFAHPLAQNVECSRTGAGATGVRFVAPPVVFAHPLAQDVESSRTPAGITRRRPARAPGGPEA